MFGMLLTCFHISYKITAQINEYSMVQGNKNGDAFCINVVIIVDSLQFDMSISLFRLVIRCSFMATLAFWMGSCIDRNLWLLSDDVGDTEFTVKGGEQIVILLGIFLLSFNPFYQDFL